MSDLSDDFPKLSINKKQLNDNDIANPCGLIAKYMFDDTYKLYDGNDTTFPTIFIDETNIAHPVDKKYKFKNPSENAGDILWRNLEDGKINLLIYYVEYRAFNGLVLNGNLFYFY